MITGQPEIFSMPSTCSTIGLWSSSTTVHKQYCQPTVHSANQDMISPQFGMLGKTRGRLCGAYKSHREMGGRRMVFGKKPLWRKSINVYSGFQLNLKNVYMKVRYTWFWRLIGRQMSKASLLFWIIKTEGQPGVNSVLFGMKYKTITFSLKQTKAKILFRSPYIWKWQMS